MQDKGRFSVLLPVRNVLGVFLVDPYPCLDTALFCPGLEKEVKLFSPRTSPSELFTREMAHRTRSSDRRMTPQHPAIGEIFSLDSMGFEPGAEWTWRLNYTLVSKESITFRMRQNIWDSNAALCFGLHPSELLTQAPGTCIKLTSKYFFLLQPNAGRKLYYWNFQKLLQCQRLYSVILQCWTILLCFLLDTDLSWHIPIHISLSCLQITSTFIFI